MSDIAGLVGSDARKPIERLRRRALWVLADHHGIKYPNGASKDVMIKLLEAHDVDVTKAPNIQWEVVQGQDEHGKTRQEIYPIEQPHASLRNGVDAGIILNDRLEKRAEEDRQREKSFETARIDALERENAQLRDDNRELKDTIEQRLAALEGKKPDETAKAKGRSRYWDLARQVKEMGINPRGKKMRELEAILANGENAS